MEECVPEGFCSVSFLQSIKRVLIVFLAAGLLSAPSAALANDEATFDSPYEPSPDVMGDVDNVLAKARSADKLALIVMGATWCHDSRGLVRRLRDEEVDAVLDQNYEVLFVDVGHLEGAREVNQRFGMPSIYATPTVMIIDPDSEKLTNGRTMHIWRNADSISYGETRSYFAHEAEKAKVPVAEPTGQLKAYFEQIDAFEALQAKRLVKGYDAISPQLAMGRGNYPEGFENLWGEVRKFRYQLTDDLLALRQQAENFAAEGLSEPLEFPSYPVMSFE